MTLSTGDVIHLRPSGNAPEIRCYIESLGISICTRLVKLTLGAISQL